MQGRFALSRRGFTLIELVIIITVIGIGAAIALPSLRQPGGYQVSAAARLLAADLDAAKVESLSHADDPRVIVFPNENDGYYIAAASDPATPINNPFDRRPYAVTYGKGRASALQIVKVGSLDLDGDRQLGFGIYGQLDQTGPALITLTADDHSLRLTVDPATGETTID